MKFKLKGIELDAFRVYEDKQLFNFLTKLGEVANLVVIYAPNGYGKTSFIDAVEWGLTGSINRISKSSIVKNTADSEKGVILKNRKSSKKFGTVTLIAENGGSLIKQTKVIGRSGRKTDYAEGDIVVKADIFSDLELSDFAIKSILGQDKIDSFLRSFSPRDRYDILTNFWDEANDSELFKNILGMNSESEKQLQQAKEQLRKIDEEIQSLIIRPNIILDINNLINKFNQIQLRELTLFEVNRDNNIQFITLLIEINSKVEFLNTDNEDKLSTSGYLVENYKLYLLKNDELNIIRKKIQEITDVLNKFKERKKELSFLDEVVFESHNLYKKYKNLKKLEKQYNEAEQILGDINNCEKLNLMLIKELSELNSLETKEEQNLKEILGKLDNVRSSKKEIENNLFKLDNNLEKYNSLENKKMHWIKRLSQLQELIDIRWNNKNEYKKKMLTLESYSKYEIQNIIEIDSDNQQIKMAISELQNSYCLKNQKEQELRDLEQEYIEFGKLTEQLNIIYKAGKKLIEDSHTEVCPLCNKEYEDFDTLINNVDRDFLEVENLNKIKSDIEKVKTVLQDEENKIENFITLFRKEIDSEITILSKRNIENEMKITAYNSLNQRIKNKLDDIKREEQKLIHFFEQLNIDIENKSLVYLTNIKYSISEKIHNLTESMIDYAQEINNKNEILKTLSEKRNHKEFEIITNKNKIRELSEEPVLKSVNKLLEECKVENNIKKIKHEFKVVKHKFLLQMDKKRVVRKRVNMLNKELEIINEQEIKDAFEEKQEDYQKVNKYIEDYNKKAKDLIVVECFQEKDIQQIHHELINEKKCIREGLTVLNELMGFTKYIEDNIATKTKNSKKKEIETQIEILERGNKELSSVKKYVTEYIESKIKNAFNLDSINSIYQRIDPHPDFNNIKFEVDLAKDKPELNIYASSKQEKLSPILYFSAAQVNVLSLSIFLAKALIEEQKGLNTIFMDDPIQHLDNLNILSFIDLLRTITVNLDKQVIISTHNENFFKLIKRKMDPDFTSSKFIELESFGKIKR
ncbi:hypothetical protein COL13_05955 [Bacillus cereus]|nr:hypothetical protein COL13_05955 [Bacillus cereus]